MLTDFTRIAAETRINLAVIDPTSGEQTEINERGPEVSAEEVEALPRAARLPGRRRQDLRARRQPAARRRAPTSTRAWSRTCARAASPSILDSEGEAMLRRPARRRLGGDPERARGRGAGRAGVRGRAATSPTAWPSWSSWAPTRRSITRPDGCVAVVGEGAERRFLEVSHRAAGAGLRGRLGRRLPRRLRRRPLRRPRAGGLPRLRGRLRRRVDPALRRRHRRPRPGRADPPGVEVQALEVPAEV